MRNTALKFAPAIQQHVAVTVVMTLPQAQAVEALLTRGLSYTGVYNVDEGEKDLAREVRDALRDSFEATQQEVGS